MNSLNGKNAIITGASSGIGKFIALLLAEHGVNLTLCGRTQETLDTVAEQARSKSVDIQTECVDFSDTPQLNQLANKLADNDRTIHMLIHSAGIIRMGAVSVLSPADVELQLKVNTLAPYTLTHALLPKLRDTHGDIVFINSRAGYITFQNNSGYCMSKFGLTALADVLREELRAESVRVSSIFPGKVATPMQEALQLDTGQSYDPNNHVDVAAIAQSVLSGLALPPNTMMSNVVIEPVKKLK